MALKKPRSFKHADRADNDYSRAWVLGDLGTGGRAATNSPSGITVIPAHGNPVWQVVAVENIYN